MAKVDIVLYLSELAKLSNEEMIGTSAKVVLYLSELAKLSNIIFYQI